MKCVLCGKPDRIVYRKMCQPCTREFRYERYRTWKERRALRLGLPFPAEGRRTTTKALLKVVTS